MEPAPFSIESVSLFFRYAFSLTAWKRFHETTWSIRAIPSSGNLHPTEGYALLPAVGAIHDRVPSVRSGRRRDGRGWRQRQAGAHIPPSGAGFRARGWRERAPSVR